MAFPTPPYTNGQTHTENGQQYQYGSGRWDKSLAAGSTPTILNSLSDVQTTTPADGDVLAFNAATSQWENVSSQSAALLARLPDAGHGYGTTVIRGLDILRTGSTTGTRIHGAGFAENLSRYFPMRVVGVENVTAWKKFYESMSNYLALSTDGHIYVGGDDSEGGLGTERVDAGSKSTEHMIRLEDANVFGPNLFVEDIFALNVNTDEGAFIDCYAVVKNTADSTYKNYFWGSNGSFNMVGVTGLANGNKLYPVEIVDLPAGKRITAVHGQNESCTLVLMEDGTVWGIGYNGAAGHLGLGTGVSPGKFAQCKLTSGSFVTNAKQVFTVDWIGGDDNSYILLNTGEVIAAGSNSLRQLGSGTTTARNTFDYVMAGTGSRLSNIKKIIGSCYEGALFLDNAGNVWHVGANNQNVRGDNISPGASVSAFASICQTGVLDAWSSDDLRGYSVVFYLKSDYKLYGAGRNDKGIRGSGNYASVAYTTGLELVSLPKGEYPVKLHRCGMAADASPNVAYIGFLALTNAGKVYGWGDVDWLGLGGSPAIIPFPLPLNDINNSI